MSTRQLIVALSRREAYPHAVDADIEVHETHISIVFLAGQFAYKVKKPIRTDFLDYSTLKLRRHYCEEELRLDRRYAEDLYVAVVAIRRSQDDPSCLRVDDPDADASSGSTSLSPIVEYAVKMRRFPDGSLLSERLDNGRLTGDEVKQLAGVVATFHHDATVCDPDFAAGWTDFLVKNIHQVIGEVASQVDDETAATLKTLHAWSDDYFTAYLRTFAGRVDSGFIRECHGDLHLQNVVHWRHRLIPFDGIEFNERLRWIDVLSDAGFLAMDLAARGHPDLSRSFLNAYLERTGDYDSLVVLRWFLFYRALIRALAASMRLRQGGL